MNNGRYLLIAVAIVSTVIAFGCGGHSSTPVSTAGYQFTNFDYTNAIGGTMATAINNNGVVVGYTTAAILPYTSFIRNTDGSFTSLSPTPVPVSTPSPGSIPTPTPSPTPTPVPTPTPTPTSGGDIVKQANALGMNDSNFVVGAITAAGVTALNGANTGAVTTFAFSTPDPLALATSTLTILPLATATTTSQTALGVSNSNIIVGQYFDSATGTTPGFVYSSGTYTTIDPAPAETLPMPSGITFAQGINKNGIVIGSFAVNGTTAQHGFAYSTVTGKYTYLPDPSTTRITTTNTLASVRFMAINDNNEAAGYYQTSNGSQYAFVFNLATLAYTFLDDPSAAEAAAHNNIQSTRITGINNAATICGTYTDGNNVTHAFIAPLH